VLIAAVENITAAAAARATLGSILELIGSLLVGSGLKRRGIVRHAHGSSALRAQAT
jgi:hypothetical protein